MRAVPTPVGKDQSEGRLLLPEHPEGQVAQSGNRNYRDDNYDDEPYREPAAGVHRRRYRCHSRRLSGRWRRFRRRRLYHRLTRGRFRRSSPVGSTTGASVGGSGVGGSGGGIVAGGVGVSAGGGDVGSTGGGGVDGGGVGVSGMAVASTVGIGSVVGVG